MSVNWLKMGMEGLDQMSQDIDWLRAHGAPERAPRIPDLSWMDQCIGPYPLTREDGKQRVVQRWPNFEITRELDGSVFSVGVTGLQPDSVIELIGGHHEMTFCGYLLPDGYHPGPPIKGFYREFEDGPMMVTVIDRTLAELAANIRARTLATAKEWPCKWCPESFPDMTAVSVHVDQEHGMRDQGLLPVWEKYGHI